MIERILRAVAWWLSPSTLAVIQAAHAYRKAEQDGTPRMWRGKDLHDLALKLDDALEIFAAERGVAS